MAVHRWALLLLAIVVAALAVTSVRDDTATGDEGAHVAAGLVKLRHGWLSFYPGQGPLMNVVTALPLGDVVLPESWRTDRTSAAHWRVGHELLYRSGNDARRVLFLARLPTIALLVVLCFAVYAFVVTQGGGRWWGVVAFALTGFCPALLAHGRLATVDLGVTTFVFLATLFFLRALQTRRIAFAIGAGAFTACALLTKTSALILGPFLLVVLFLHWRRERSIPWSALAVSAAAALVIFEGVYLALASREWVAVRHPSTPLLLVPFAEYLLQIQEIGRWYSAGHDHPQFLLGEFSRTGWRHYFLIAFLLKTPIAAQLLFAGAIVAVRRGSLALRSCVLFVALFLAVSAGSHVNLGVRYILPVYPFVYAAVALMLSQVVINRRRQIVAAVLVAWHVVSSLVAWPGYLSYFNELIGSRRNADRFLIDSNLDWGQDLHRLKLWADANGVELLRIDYFGGGDLAYEFGSKAQRWSAPRPQLLPQGWFAVSRHFYRVSFDPRESPVDYDTYLEASKARYVTTVGGSIDVYRVD